MGSDCSLHHNIQMALGHTQPPVQSVPRMKQLECEDDPKDEYVELHLHFPMCSHPVGAMWCYQGHDMEVSRQSKNSFCTAAPLK